MRASHSPRFVPPLARAFEAAGGLAHILLTHRDDVPDAERFASRFGARVWVHEHDRRAAPQFPGPGIRAQSSSAAKPRMGANAGVELD